MFLNKLRSGSEMFPLSPSFFVTSRSKSREKKRRSVFFFYKQTKPRNYTTIERTAFTDQRRGVIVYTSEFGGREVH